MKKITGLVAVLLLMIVGSGLAGIEYNYIDSDSLMKSLQEKKPIHLVDIQKKMISCSIIFPSPMKRLHTQ